MAEEKKSSESPFLDVHFLLEESQPRARGTWFWYAVGFFFLVVLLSAYAQRSMPNGGQIVQMLSSLMMFALMIAMGFITWRAARAVQGEQGQLEAIEELIQLRRWEEAALLVQALLSRSTRTPQGRTQALVFLAAILARYHRFADAVSVYEHMLENRLVEGEAAYGMKLARAMSLLREDRLVDADRAMGELRRLDRADDSAGLALLEIYRDVKTGHPREAIEEFEKKQALLRRQLGHRAADGYALAAKAFDLAGESEKAREAFEKATLLSPMVELKRRYPEIGGMEEKYPAVSAPAEVGLA
jgi:tetratricopeptide (TPR) repeat protein